MSDSNPEPRCKNAIRSFPAIAPPTEFGAVVPLAKKSTSLRFTNCAKSMAIRSRSCRACESASICLWPNVVMLAVLLRSCVKSKTSNTGTPTVTSSSAKVKAANHGAPPGIGRCDRSVVNHRSVSIERGKHFDGAAWRGCGRINWRWPSNSYIDIT